MKAFQTYTEICQQERRREIRDKIVAGVMFSSVIGIFIDLNIRGADSLFGRAFIAYVAWVS